MSNQKGEAARFDSAAQMHSFPYAYFLFVYVWLHHLLAKWKRVVVIDTLLAFHAQSPVVGSWHHHSSIRTEMCCLI